MPAYNFKSQFAPAVEAGTKLCTVRGWQAKASATAYLFTGMRTKACRRLGQGKITDCSPIIIGRDPSAFPLVIISGQRLSLPDIWQLASHDGFEDSEKFVEFFADSQPYKTIDGVGTQFFEGFIHTWELDK